MANSMKVKVLEVLGPTKFSVRPNLKEGSFHSLQRKLDQHYFDLQFYPSEYEERIPLSEGDSVRSVELVVCKFISVVHSNWSRNVEAWLSLVESNAPPALLCHKEPARASKAPY